MAMVIVHKWRKQDDLPTVDYGALHYKDKSTMAEALSRPIL